MTVEVIAQERLRLLEKKFSSGLTFMEEYRLQQLTDQLRALEPRVTQADLDWLKKMQDDLQ